MDFNASNFNYDLRRKETEKNDRVFTKTTETICREAPPFTVNMMGTFLAATSSCIHNREFQEDNKTTIVKISQNYGYHSSP
jgi:hypothetical protein